jgi:alkane 1-monooxygenase
VKSRTETRVAIFVRTLAVFLPAIVGVGIALRGVFTFAGVFVLFVVLSAVEVLLKASGIGAKSRPREPEVAVLRRGARIQLWIYSLLHVALYPYVLYLVTTDRLGALETFGAGASVACMAGTVGGMAGHDLIHKRSALDRALGIAVYATSSYGHFYSSHIGGHHVNVGLRDDWGTARRGETIYGFLYRAMVHGFVGGLKIEAARLRRRGRSGYGLGNFVVVYAAVTIVAYVLLAVVAGPRTLLFVLAVSVVSIAFMELFNYISHYALTRTSGVGGAEPIAPEHTWESNDKVVNWFIFNAGLHKHHHDKPAHGFERLTLFEDADYIPYGIAMMAFVSFVPPLYLRKMESILAHRESRRAAKSGP